MRLFTALLLILPLLGMSQKERVPYFVNEVFSENIFPFHDMIGNFKKFYSSTLAETKKPITNSHGKSDIDTVYIFTHGKTKIEIYKAKGQEILTSAKIYTDKIPLKYGIKIGVSKSEMAKLLKRRIIADKIFVGDLEQNQFCTFRFVKGHLAAVSYHGYLD